MRSDPRRIVIGACVVLIVGAAGCTGSPTVPNSAGVGGSDGVARSTRTGASGSVLIPPDLSGTAPKPVPPAAPGIPEADAVADVPWLSGRPDQAGVQMKVPGGISWQGPTPGENAVITPGGYRAFGPDGSVVGCTSEQACVGITAGGQVVVSQGRADPRFVYRGDGTMTGRFAVDGTALRPDGAVVPDLAAAIAETGVNVPELLDAATARIPFAGGASGDPHLITAGGRRFSSQLTGQFVARGGDPARGIQVQLEPMAHRSDVSIVTAVAVGASGHRIELAQTGLLSIDRRVADWTLGFHQEDLGDGVAVGRWRSRGSAVVRVAVVWPDGGNVVMDANPALGVTVVAHLPMPASVVGLFGSGDAAPAVDLLSRGGKPEDVAAVVSSWRVTRDESLFAVPVAPVNDFPSTSAEVDPRAMPAASAACAAVGIRQAQDRASCAFDVALTGDQGFAAGHAAMAVPAERGAIAADIARRFPALLPGNLAGATDLPAGGHIDVTMAPAEERAFRIGLDHSGTITVVNQRRCDAGADRPGIDEAAFRVFGRGGNPVDARLGLCGRESIGPLPAGQYYLVLAGVAPTSPSASAAPATPAMSVTASRMQVSVS